MESGETVREWRVERHGVDVRDSTFGQCVDRAMRWDAARRGWAGMDGTLMIGGDARGIVGARMGVACCVVAWDSRRACVCACVRVCVY